MCLCSVRFALEQNELTCGLSLLCLFPQILWEDERAERGVTTKQSFVDLGCGNGLLVHILSSEGVSMALLSFLKGPIGWAKGPHVFLFLIF